MVGGKEIVANKAVDQHDTGAQIDMLIDRRDGVISVCEMKYSDDEFSIDKGYAKELASKLAVFKRVTDTKKSIMLAFVTTFGVKENDYKRNLVQNSVTLEALFG